MADPIRVSGPIRGPSAPCPSRPDTWRRKAKGAVVASIGTTTVLTTANAAHDVRPGVDFFPLTVDVEERACAAGKIPGSFFRREGRPTEGAILTCRLTDRPLRPSFPKGFRNETQVVTTVIRPTRRTHDVLSINAASAALMISGIPFEGPIGAGTSPTRPTASGCHTRRTRRATPASSSSSSPAASSMTVTWRS